MEQQVAAVEKGPYFSLSSLQTSDFFSLFRLSNQTFF